jgi:hypothetical protein
MERRKWERFKPFRVRRFGFVGGGYGGKSVGTLSVSPIPHFASKRVFLGLECRALHQFEVANRGE